MKYLSILSFLLSFNLLGAPLLVSCLSDDGTINIRYVNRKSKTEFSDIRTPYNVFYKITHLKNDNKLFKGRFETYNVEDKDEKTYFTAESASSRGGELENVYLSLDTADLQSAFGVLEFTYDLDEDGTAEEVIKSMICTISETIQ